MKKFKKLLNNYCYLIRFKNDNDLYMSREIEYKELEKIIISTYRYENSNIYKYSNTFYNYIKEPIYEAAKSFKYDEKVKKCISWIFVTFTLY